MLRSTIVRTVLFLGIAVAALLLSHASDAPIESKTNVQARARLGTP